LIIPDASLIIKSPIISARLFTSKGEKITSLNNEIGLCLNKLNKMFDEKDKIEKT